MRIVPCPDRFTEGTRSVCNRSSGAQEAPHSNEVVRDHAQGEYPTDQGQPFHLDLPDSRHRFEPPKGMLDRLAPDLADAVTGVTGRPLVDRARPPRIGVLSDVWSNALGAHRRDEAARVVGFVRRQSRTRSTRHVAHECLCGFTFGATRRLGGHASHYQAVAVFDDHVTQVAELRFGAMSLAVQTGLRIRRRLMRLVRPLFPPEIPLPSSSRTTPRRTILLLETLLARPRLHHRAVDAEVLVRGEPAASSFRHDLLQKPLSEISRQEPLSVLSEGRGIPYPIVHAQAHEPAEQKVVVELFHEQPLAPYPVEVLKQERPQQSLRRHRWPSHLRVQPLEVPGKPLQGRVRDLPDDPQRVVLRHTLRRRHVAEHGVRLHSVTPHPYLLRRLAREGTMRTSHIRTFSAGC